MENCLFCKIWKDKEKEFIYENESFFSIINDNPVNKGHSLIISKRHIKSFFDLKKEESIQLLEVVKKIKEILDNKFSPDGYNIGVNNGESAGQTIFHLHIHLIPRYVGDVNNSIGGVRNIIPGKGDYTK